MARDGTTQEKYRRNAERYESDPADGEREVTGPPVPPPPGPGRRRTTDLRGVPDAIRHMPATGCRWRAIPGRFPPFTTIQDHFHPWRDSGVSGRMPGALRGLARDPAGPCGHDARGKARGRGRNVAAGVGGTPIAVRARTADIQDRDGAPDTVPGMPGKAPEVRRVWADSGHGGERLRETLAGMGVPDAPEIVRGPDGTGGFTVPCRRWVVERTFAWMPRRRRLGRDSGRSLESSVAWARPGACRFPVRRLARGAGGREQKEYPEQ